MGCAAWVHSMVTGVWLGGEGCGWVGRGGVGSVGFGNRQHWNLRAVPKHQSM